MMKYFKIKKCYFLLDNVKYIIKDLGNQNRYIYFDMLVEMC